MCGRFTITTEKELLISRFKAWLDLDLPARYNAAPMQMLPVITEDEPDRIKLFRWGLTPPWFKKISGREALINIRAETLRDKPTFRKDFSTRRCLVLADGFYEWQKAGRLKRPFWIGLKNRQPFAFAGLWEENTEDDANINSFAIITTEPNKWLMDIHNRMPVILEKSDEQDWLDARSGTDKLLSLLHPYNFESMMVYPVSTRVNSVTNDNPLLMEEMK